jgi:hypothetical protein
MEPTAAEANTLPKEYRITQGVTVHIGAQEYEVVFYGADTVVLQDTRFPLLQTEYSQADFLKMIAENPLNDQLLHTVEGADEPKQDEVPESTEEVSQNDESESRLDEMLRQAYSALGDKLAENTDLVKQVVETMVGPTGKKLKYTGEDSEEGGGDDSFGLGGDEDSGGDEEGGFSLDEGGGDEGGGDEGFSLDEEGGGESPATTEDEGGDEMPAAPEEGGEEGGSTDDKVREYLDGITGGDEDGDDGKAKEYIDNIVGEGSDDNAEKYIDSFLGKSGGDVKESSDDSDALQDAVLVDEPEESSASPNDVGDFLTGR